MLVVAVARSSKSRQASRSATTRGVTRSLSGPNASPSITVPRPP